MKPPVDVELTTVADTHAVFHRGDEVIRIDNLQPGTEHTELGITFRTLTPPPGRLLSTFRSEEHTSELQSH